MHVTWCNASQGCKVWEVLDDCHTSYLSAQSVSCLFPNLCFFIMFMWCLQKNTSVPECRWILYSHIFPCICVMCSPGLWPEDTACSSSIVILSVTHHQPWQDLYQSNENGTDNTEEKNGLEWMVKNGIVVVMVVGVRGVWMDRHWRLVILNFTLK